MLVDGNKIASDILLEVSARVTKLDTPPRLAAVTCAPNFETKKYLEMKKRKAASVGIILNVVELPHNAETKDVLDCMKKDTGLDLQGLRVDGGAVQNNFLMQFQADILQSNISKPKISEITGLGAVFLAGLAVGFWKDKEELKTIMTIDKTFEPQLAEETVAHDYKGWKKAVERSMAWAE
jgi:5,10-methylene-tetrahydrofolate dehydrogenase/methenyl tetrahydrofolate cyclohydrolase